MTKTLTAVFDGVGFRPDVPLALEPNTRYRVTIESIPSAPTTGADAWEMLEMLTGTVEAPADWATEHDHYVYGTPRRQSEAKA